MKSNFSNINQNQFPHQALNNQNNPYSPDLIDNSNVVNINKPVLSYYHKSISREEIELDKNNINKPSLSNNKISYLPITDWTYLTDDNIITIERNYAKQAAKINRESYNRLLASVKKCNLAQVHSNRDVVYNVSTLGTLESLIEENFLSDPNNQFQMASHLLKLEDHIYKWRHIKGEGNCFYRAVIFTFLENIVITNNLYLLKEFAIEFYEKININNPSIQNIPYLLKIIKSLNTEITTQLLHLLIELLEQENITQCYEVLFKAFCFCPPFDLAIIFYLKYLLYEFIKNNQTKAYNEEFCVQLGNLLPKEYQSDNGKFNFEKYYEEKLLQLGVDAEIIVIYITPFVLKCDLKVIMYDFELNNDDFLYIKEFKCGLNDKLKIEVIFRKIHYDISYSRDYFNKYQNFLSIYTNLNETIKVLDSFTVENLHSLLKENPDTDLFTALIHINEQKMNKQQPMNTRKSNTNTNININQNTNNNTNNNNNQMSCNFCNAVVNNSINIPLCAKCLGNELTNQITNLYLSYLKLVYKEHERNPKLNFAASFDVFFSNQTMTLYNNKQYVQDLITLTNYSFMEYINEAKKKICLFCFKTIDSFNCVIKLPCSCYFCSQQCCKDFYDYFLVHDFDRKVEYNLKKYLFSSCPCGYKYSFNDFNNLYKNLNNNLMRENIRKLLKGKWITTCAKCGCTLNENRYTVFEFKSKKLSEFNMKNAKHGLCGRCEQMLKEKTNYVDCKFCQERHEILKKKQIDTNDEQDCVIF